MRLTLLIYFIAISNIITFSQIQKEWGRNLPGLSINNKGNSICTDNNNNVYVTGVINQVIAIAKYDAAGNLLWSKIYDNGLEEKADKIILDLNGNIFLAGSKYNNGTRDILLYKLSVNGDSLWVKYYNSPDNSGEYSCDMIIDNNNNIYLSGVSLSSNSYFITLKYDNNGNILWSKTYPMNDLNYTTPNSILKDNSTNIYIVGRTHPVSTLWTTTIVKYSSNGDQIWAKNVDSLDIDKYSSSLDLNNNIYISGINQNYHCRTVKISQDGNIIWSRTFAGDFGYVHNTVSSNNIIYVSGTATVMPQYDIINLCYNQNGVLQWTDTVNTASYEEPYKMLTDNSNNCYILSNIYYSSIGLLKYSPSGQLLTEYTDSNVAGKGKDFCIRNNNIFITGSRDNNIGYFYTAKYSQVIGIQPISTEIPKSFTLSQNYPNPFNPVTKIKFSLPQSGNVRLTVYDALGKEIKVLVSENLKAGIYETDFDATETPSGIYFYRIEFTDPSTSLRVTETKKMVVIK